MLQDRDFLENMTRLLRLATAGLFLLFLLSYFLPYFNYTGVAKKETQDSISVWGYLLFPKNFPQMEVLLDVRYLNVATLKFPLLNVIISIFSIVILLRKKGIGTTIFPLFFSIWSIIGHFASEFLSYGNVAIGRWVPFVITIIILAVTVFSIILYVAEIKSRPDDYYLPLLDT